MKNLLASLGLAFMTSSSHAAEYSVGQVWTYTSRVGEEESRLQINRIEDDSKLGRVFHISLSGVHIRNPHSTQGYSTELPHLPVSKATLDSSVVTLTKDKPRPVEYETGYAQWKQAHGGVFTVTVAECVKFVEQTLRSSKK